MPLVGLLAGLASGEDALDAMKAAEAKAAAKPIETGIVHVDAPDLRFDAAGFLLAPHGFVARIDERILVGNALRYDRTNDDLYASGQVVYVMPGVRLHIDRLGLHPKAENGDGWGVEAFIDHQGRRLVLRAEHVHLDRHELVFTNVHADGGHGGILGVNASSAHVYLRDVPAKDRKGFERQVAGVSMVSPTASLAGVPVLWAPYVYRDFVLDYPWTRYEAGHTRRLGYYGRGWIGTNLLSIWDWHPRIELRGDAYSRSGEGYGAHAHWYRPDMGAGRITWFDVPHEIVMGGASDTDNIEERHASAFDAEQKLPAWAGYSWR